MSTVQEIPSWKKYSFRSTRIQKGYPRRSYSNFRLMFHHILPNSISPIIVTMTQQVGNTILSEAGLSFLGLGISKPTATWGALVNGGRSFLLTNPIYSLAPGIAIALLVICLNTLGDGVRDALDPRLRGEV